MPLRAIAEHGVSARNVITVHPASKRRVEYHLIQIGGFPRCISLRHVTKLLTDQCDREE